MHPHHGNHLTNTDPGLWASYGPLVSALLALLGVAITLWVTGRRESRKAEGERSRVNNERIDAFRAEQRTAIASVLATAQHYQREVSNAGRIELLAQRDEPFARHVVEDADRIRSQLLAELTVARLLVHHGQLQDALDRLYGQWSRTGEIFVGFYHAFWAAEPDIALVRSLELQEEWLNFGDAAAVLQSVAMDVLKPTVVSDVPPSLL